MKHLYACLFLLPLFFACSPLTVVRVEPSADETVDRYLYGNPVQRAEDAGVAVEVNYYDASRTHLVFDLTVTNTGDQPIEFDPAATVLIPDVGEVLPAVDPEIQLLGMDMQSVRDQRARRTLAWVGGAVLVGAVAYDLSNGNGGVANDAGSNFAALNLTATVADAVTFAVYETRNNQNYRDRIPAGTEVPTPDNRFFWLDYSFRRTTIRPGETAVGKVVFARNDRADNFVFQTTVGERDFTFRFSQRVFKP